MPIIYTVLLALCLCFSYNSIFSQSDSLFDRKLDLIEAWTPEYLVNYESGIEFHNKGSWEIQDESDIYLHRFIFKKDSLVFELRYDPMDVEGSLENAWQKSMPDGEKVIGYEVANKLYFDLQNSKAIKHYITLELDMDTAIVPADYMQVMFIRNNKLFEIFIFSASSFLNHQLLENHLDEIFRNLTFLSKDPIPLSSTDSRRLEKFGRTFYKCFVDQNYDGLEKLLPTKENFTATVESNFRDRQYRDKYLEVAKNSWDGFLGRHNKRTTESFESMFLSVKRVACSLNQAKFLDFQFETIQGFHETKTVQADLLFEINSVTYSIPFESISLFNNKWVITQLDCSTAAVSDGR